MRVLLDTHLVLWALAAPERLPGTAHRLIERADVYVSAASIWEISIKTSLGKLSADPREVLAALDPAGFLPLPISAEHAAQALCEPMRLLTMDTVLAGYGELVTVV
jgi:PIN domain nuclease of toxin-antitoxin system